MLSSTTSAHSFFAEALTPSNFIPYIFWTMRKKLLQLNPNSLIVNAKVTPSRNGVTTREGQIATK